MKTRIFINRFSLFSAALIWLSVSCTVQHNKKPEPVVKNEKIVIYQVFTRLFGNTNTTNKPWGTLEENGVGKFNDLTDLALQEIKIWELHTFGTPVFHITRLSTITRLMAFQTTTLMLLKAVPALRMR